MIKIIEIKILVKALNLIFNYIVLISHIFE